MRQDFIIGMTVAAAIHGGVFLQGVLFPNRPPTKVAAAKSEVIQLEAPKPPPLEEEKDPEPADAPSKPIDVVAPATPDLPQVTTSLDFVQRVQPPPPDGVKPSATLYNIPETRTFTPGNHGQPIFDPASLDHVPEARYRTPPQYPYEMKRNGVTGEVVVDFIVDSNGNVQNAYALKSSQREFEAAAIQAVSKWKFKPGYKGGRAVNTHMQVPIVFNLEND